MFVFSTKLTIGMHAISSHFNLCTAIVVFWLHISYPSLYVVIASMVASYPAPFPNYALLYDEMGN